MNIGIVGCGNMGSAIVYGMLEKKFCKTDSVFLSDKSIKKVNILSKKTKCIKKDLFTLIKESKLIIIAVKPQDFVCLADKIKNHINKDHIIVSIMAGISIKKIKQLLEKDILVARVMPNIGAFIGESMSFISYSYKFNKKYKQNIYNMFLTVGNVKEIKESALNDVTALCGSGPAYFFYLADAMIDTCINEFKFKKNIAKQIVLQTLYGSSCFLKKENIDPEILIKKVASKGGTTEAAIKIFNNKNMKSIIKSAIIKAKKRAQEITGG